MLNTLFTLPGKKTDNLMRLPVAYQYSRQHDTKIDICLDKNSELLASVLKNQDWIENILIEDGIKNYNFGGQPIDFGKHEEFSKKYNNVFHLGYRPKMAPDDNLTISAAGQARCPIDLKPLLSEACIATKIKPTKFLCIHLNANDAELNKDVFDTLMPILPKVRKYFEKIYVIGGSANEFTLPDYIEIFNDGGDLNRAVSILSESILVGPYGSMWALANCIKSYQIVVANIDNPICHGKKSYDQEVWVSSGDTQTLSAQIYAMYKTSAMVPAISSDGYVYIGETDDITRGLGDSLLLTAVIREVNLKYPDKKIVVRTTGPASVFNNNPRIYIFENNYWENVDIWPNGRWRNKHQIYNLYDTYGVFSDKINTEIFLTEQEILVATKTLELLSPNKPVIVFCRNSTDTARDWDDESWEKIVSMLSEKYNVFQIDENIRYDRTTEMPRVMKTTLAARQELRGLDIRRIFALMSASKKYLGVNTGLMAAATAFGDDNFVFMHSKLGGDPHWIFPHNKNFFEYEKFDDIIDRIKKDWME